jgi:L-lactate dehydrogenase complex protein LldE
MPYRKEGTALRVALFATCLADQLFPEVAVASVKLLRHLGVEVAFPQAQTCCGQPAYNAGYQPQAREIAGHHLEVFEGFDYVVLPSGSCGAMVREHYPELFRDAPDLEAIAVDLAARTFELTTFITEVLQCEDIGADLKDLRVTFHDSCHAMRSMGVYEAPRTLLKAAGADLVEADSHDVCCGFGGLFSVKMPEISSAMAAAKRHGIDLTEATVLTSTDGGCLMQLQGSLSRSGARIQVRHIAELLWEGVERRAVAAYS